MQTAGRELEQNFKQRAGCCSQQRFLGIALYPGLKTVFLPVAPGQPTESATPYTLRAARPIQPKSLALGDELIDLRDVRHGANSAVRVCVVNT